MVLGMIVGAVVLFVGMILGAGIYKAGQDSKKDTVWKNI